MKRPNGIAKLVRSPLFRTRVVTNKKRKASKDACRGKVKL